MLLQITRYLLVVLVATLTVPVGFAAPTVADNDAGTGGDASDTTLAPTHIAPGYHTGRVAAAVDPRDVYSFDVVAGQGLEVYVSGSVFVPSYSLTTPSQGYACTCPHLARETGAYVLVVSGMVASYGLTINVVDLPPQDDAGSGRDAGDKWYEDPVPIALGTYSGTTNRFDTSDAYAFTHGGGTLFGSLDAPFYGYLTLVNASGSWFYGEGNASRRTWAGLPSGDYRLVVSGYDWNRPANESSTYTFRLSADGAGDPSAPPNDNRASATPLTLPAGIRVDTTNATREASEYTYCYETATVWYRFTAPTAGIVRIETNASFSVSTMLYRAGDGYPWGSTCYASSVGFTVDAGRTYDLRLAGVDGARGIIDASIEFEPARVADLAVRIDDVERRPIETEFGEVPNMVNEVRTVVATVTNHGPDAVPARVDLQTTRGTAPCGYGYTWTYEDDEWVPFLAPGESATVRLQWATGGSVGDQTVRVGVYPASPHIERDWRDNAACRETWVVVGGLGGVA